MTVKDVYSIRITKNDDEIKDYLEQFPSSKQNKALKSLLKYGIEKLQEDYSSNQEFNRLQEMIKNIQEAQENKLEEIKKIISNLQVSSVKNVSEPTDDNDSGIDYDKARKSMEEALSMFTG